jgi:TnpA family transposase
LRLVDQLPLEGIPAASNLLDALSSVAGDTDYYYDYVIMDVSSDFLPRDWRPLVLNYDRDDGCERFDRRQLEVVAILELAEAIKAGEVFIQGSLSYDQFWERLPPEASDPAAMASYATERGWPGGADGFVRQLADSLSKEAHALDEAIHKYGCVDLGKDGRPVVSPIHRVQPPPSAVELERSILERIPERPVLAALANTQCWTDWHRHFGLPSRLNPQIKDAANRYVLTAFTYGCGLGPTQAARHFDGTVSADQLRFVDRRHIDIADLRSASVDLVNLYAQFELPRLWGSGEAAVADGTHFETYEDNLLAERHIRYGKTGGIAYRHIADNYIALFSYFIACGHYEAVYILDALQLNVSDVRPRRVHADTHGQSAAVFGLAYLLGIELMPRIRYWKKLRFYKAASQQYYRSIEALFSGTIKWNLIREHYWQFMQLAIAIQSGKLTPSAVLARLNSHSTRNHFCLALQELGKAVRTRFLLQWVGDQPLRSSVHKCTTKIERHHHFSKYLCFGGDGLLRSNDRADQEKAIVYNELIANAVALQNVVDQTQALHQLKAEGAEFTTADLAFLSPYATSKLQRFGDYPTQFNPEPLTSMALPS